MKKRTYRSFSIQDVTVDALVALFGAALEVIVAIDVAKQKMVFGVATSTGETRKLVRFDHPTQTRAFLALMSAIRDRGVSIAFVMEPTGAYGDALRHQLLAARFPVFVVDPKRTHDASLVFDGVPSQHDPKACTILAQLHARGLSKPFRQRSRDEKRARAFVDRHRTFQRPFQQLAGTIEPSSRRTGRSSARSSTSERAGTSRSSPPTRARTSWRRTNRGRVISFGA